MFANLVSWSLSPRESKIKIQGFLVLLDSSALSGTVWSAFGDRIVNETNSVFSSDSLKKEE